MYGSPLASLFIGRQIANPPEKKHRRRCSQEDAQRTGQSNTLLPRPSLIRSADATETSEQPNQSWLESQGVFESVAARSAGMEWQRFRTTCAEEVQRVPSDQVGANSMPAIGGVAR